jgi:hypothetical protein
MIDDNTLESEKKEIRKNLEYIFVKFCNCIKIPEIVKLLEKYIIKNK